MSPPPSTSSRPDVARRKPVHHTAVDRRVSALRTQQVAHRGDELKGHDRLGQERAGACPPTRRRPGRAPTSPAPDDRRPPAGCTAPEPPPAIIRSTIDRSGRRCANSSSATVGSNRRAHVISLGAQEVLEQLRRIPVALGEQHHDRHNPAGPGDSGWRRHPTARPAVGGRPPACRRR